MSIPTADAAHRRPRHRPRPRDQAADHRARHGRLPSRSTTPAWCAVTVLLTVSGCPLKDTIDRDVRRAPRRRRRRHRRRAHPRRDDRRAAGRAPDQTCAAASRAKEIPFAQPGSLTKVFAIASGKGGVGKSSVTVNLALALAKAGPHGRHRRRRHLRPLGPRHARHRRLPADPGRGHDHAGADAVGRLGDLDRHAQAAPRPGRRLARPDARPGARADARRRLLGRPRRPPARPAARAPATWRSRSASTCPNAEIVVVTTPQEAAAEVAERAGTMASMMHQRVVGVVENMSYLVCPHCGPTPPARDLRQRRRRPGGRDALRAGSGTTYRVLGPDPDRAVRCARAATPASRSSSPTPPRRPPRCSPRSPSALDAPRPRSGRTPARAHPDQ